MSTKSTICILDDEAIVGDRLKPEMSIKYGLIYFARLMKEQDGDISLALASYNAGPHRVKEYRGIPPFNETIQFRNRILRFYREYLERYNGMD